MMSDNEALTIYKGGVFNCTEYGYGGLGLCLGACCCPCVIFGYIHQDTQGGNHDACCCCPSSLNRWCVAYVATMIVDSVLYSSGLALCRTNLGPFRSIFSADRRVNLIRRINADAHKDDNESEKDKKEPSFLWGCLLHLFCYPCTLSQEALITKAIIHQRDRLKMPLIKEAPTPRTMTRKSTSSVNQGSPNFMNQTRGKTWGYFMWEWTKLDPCHPCPFHTGCGRWGNKSNPSCHSLNSIFRFFDSSNETEVWVSETNKNKSIRVSTSIEYSSDGIDACAAIRSVVVSTCILRHIIDTKPS
jgi:hypothetical protein